MWSLELRFLFRQFRVHSSKSGGRPPLTKELQLAWHSCPGPGQQYIALKHRMKGESTICVSMSVWEKGKALRIGNLDSGLRG